MSIVPRNRLASLGMFFLFVVLSQALAAGLQFGLAMSHVIDTNDQSWRPSIFIGWETAAFVASVAVSLLICWLQGRRLRELGYDGTGVVRQILWGSFWGLIAPTALIALIATLGGFSFGTVAMSGQKLALYTVGWLVAFFGVGVAEEAQFRATPQITLGESIGPWPAAIAISTIFALVHYFLKPGENVADALSVGLLGLFMAFTVIRSGSIWYAVGFHALFDYAAMFLYGAPNSGNGGQPVPTKLLTGGYHGPDWLTGGKLGIEASWLVFPVIAALFLGYHVATRRTTSSAPPVGYNLS